jgi:hypothetical protein
MRPRFFLCLTIRKMKIVVQIQDESQTVSTVKTADIIWIVAFVLLTGVACSIWFYPMSLACACLYALYISDQRQRSRENGRNTLLVNSTSDKEFEIGGNGGLEAEDKAPIEGDVDPATTRADGYGATGEEEMKLEMEKGEQEIELVYGGLPQATEREGNENK